MAAEAALGASCKRECQFRMPGQIARNLVVGDRLSIDGIDALIGNRESAELRRHDRHTIGTPDKIDDVSPQERIPAIS
jgi:hypothetical protein